MKEAGLNRRDRSRDNYLKYVKVIRRLKNVTQCSCKRNVQSRMQSRDKLGQEVEGRLGKVMQNQVKFWRKE